MKKHITLPLTSELAQTLRAGDAVYLTGAVYTSRDAGHKRMCEALQRGEPLPFDPTDATIYYVGPTPAKPGQVIGSAGPTTSGRMDAYAPAMMAAGALIARCVKRAELIAYEDLGAEALRRLWVEEMPLVVIIDCEGNNLYETGRKAYLDSLK